MLSKDWSWESHPFAWLSAGNSIQCKESALQMTFRGPLVCGWPCRPHSSGSCPLDVAEGELLWGLPTLPPCAQLLFCRSGSELLGGWVCSSCYPPPPRFPYLRPGAGVLGQLSIGGRRPRGQREHAARGPLPHLAWPFGHNFLEASSFLS